MDKQARLESLRLAKAEAKDQKQNFLYGAEMALGKQEFHHVVIYGQRLVMVEEHILSLMKEIKDLEEQIDEEKKDIL